MKGRTHGTRLRSELGDSQRAVLCPGSDVSPLEQYWGKSEGTVWGEGQQTPGPVLRHPGLS